MNKSKTLLDTAKVTDLRGLQFIIKDYQRGYRWDRQQAHDLLRDISEFPIESEDDWYCIQPLVVKPIAEEMDELKNRLIALAESEDLTIDKIQNEFSSRSSYEVIDGQQRLTTLYILLKYLGEEDPFAIIYETRKGSREFLKNIREQNDETEINKFIDYYNMVEVRDEIDEWFQDVDKESFKEKLEHVRFIWYVTDEDAIEVFERLNIGKIALTNAELIKALFLNRYNFSQDNERFILEQHKMALAWDDIEKRLQDDEFWLFIHGKEWGRPTRIDYLFDIICQNDILHLKELLELDDEKYEKRLGNDKYRTFRYFYEFVQNEKTINKSKAVNTCWSFVAKYFHIFEEWFSDMQLYHYIGFLIETKASKDIQFIMNLLQLWEGIDPKTKEKKPCTKNSFKETVKGMIRNHFSKEVRKTINYVHLSELRYGNPMTKDALLLYNLETVVRQNNSYKGEDKYRMETFYRFPFHLYKKEVGKNNKGWDVEHIDSATTNPLRSVADQKDWIKTAFIELPGDKQELFKNRVTQFITDKGNAANGSDFQTLFDDIMAEIPQPAVPLKEDADVNKNEKYFIWNLALLDSGTNRSYKNSVFPAKRRCIIGRDKGEVYTIEIDEMGTSKVTPSKSAIAFIPPCTKNAFLKYYSPDSNNLLTWGRPDAELYYKDMVIVLQPFIDE